MEEDPLGLQEEEGLLDLQGEVDRLGLRALLVLEMTTNLIEDEEHDLSDQKDAPVGRDAGVGDHEVQVPWGLKKIRRRLKTRGRVAF